MGRWRRLALVVVVAASAVGVGGCSVLGGGGGKITIEPSCMFTSRTSPSSISRSSTISLRGAT